MDEISPKSMVFLPPNLIHSCNPMNRDLWGYKMLFINPDWVQGFTSSQGDCSFHVPIVQDISTCETLQLVNTMMERLISQASPLEKEASLLAVFEQALSGEKKKCNQSSRHEGPKLKIIQDYLQSCFLEKITLAQLEQASGLNKFHIIRLFKEAFNIPPHTYQILLRINYAKKELGRHRQLADIAIAAGFYDQSHFSKVFKSYTGITPEGYQKFIR
jgi:AraC-like DNA-binding protein